MAKGESGKDEITISVPMRRLLTGVPRTQRAHAAVPRVKRFVLRHIDPDWRDAIWDEERGRHRVWIDDFLNKTIWSRGRERIGGPVEWVEGSEGTRPRLARRTTARYGSVLKVKALFVEEPRDGGDPRLEVYLYGYDDLAKEKEEEEAKGEEEAEEEKEEGAEAEEEEGPEVEEEAEEEKAAAKEPEAEAPKVEERKPAEEPKGAAKKPASKSAAAKGGKAATAPKAEPKKSAPKPKKEGGD
jgi:ribosomal protein L31E